MKQKSNLKMKIKLLTAIIFFTCLMGINKSFAQCPPNIGFENGDLQGWQCFIDNWQNASSSGGCCPIAANMFIGMNHPIQNRIEVVTGNGTDPNSGLPMVCPSYGNTINNYSLKLGNDSSYPNSHSERVRTQFVVNSVNSSLIYRYSAVLESGGHACADQPRVVFTVYDGGPISAPYASPVVSFCPSFNICSPTSSTNMPPGWFVSGNGRYCSNWIPVSVNLYGLVGHLVIVEFATGDCSFGGHSGYAYLDIPGGCTPFAINTAYCPGAANATLHGPPGFSSYSWYQLPGWTLLGSFDSVTVAVPTTIPPVPVPIAVVVTPPNGIGCNDTLIDTLRIAPIPISDFGVNQVLCANSPTQFLDSSSAGLIGGYITSWQWDFGDTASHANNYSNIQNPIHIFSDTGSYSVQLIVTSNISCISDTAIFTIVNINLPPYYPNAGADQTICLNLTATMNPVIPPPGCTYYWTTHNGLHYPANGIGSSPADTATLTPVVHPVGTTTYYLTVTNSVGCAFTDSITVHTVGVAPDAYIVATPDTICPGGSSQLLVSVIPTFCGTTTSASNGIPTLYNIGSGGFNVAPDPSPFKGSYSDGRVQVLIRSSELAGLGITAGQIKGLSFNVTNKTSYQPYQNFSVQMGCTNQNQFTSTTFYTGLSTVLNPVSYSTVAGVNQINFTTPFNWDGVSNLVIQICYDNSGVTGNDDVAQTSTTFLSALYGYDTQFGVSGCTNTSFAFQNTSFDRPSIGLNFSIPNLATAIYTWTSNQSTLSCPTCGNPVATPTTGVTTYNVTVDDGNGCLSYATKTIVVDSSTSINAGPDATVCIGTVQNLNATVTGIGPFVYNWTSNPVGFTSVLPNPAVSPTVTTTYTVTAFGQTGCNVADNVVINAFPIPTSSFTVNPNPVCSGSNALVTYTGTGLPAASYTWNWDGGTIISGSGAGPYNIQWATAGVKNVTLFVTQNGCTSVITTVQVTVNLTPTSIFTVNPNPACSGIGNPVTITYTGNAPATATYNWNFVGGVVLSGSGQGPYQVYWNTGGAKNISLDVLDNGCSSTTTVITLVVNLVPTSTFILPAAACSGQNVNVIYTGNMTGTATYNWNWGPGGTSLPGGGIGPLQVQWASAGTKNVTLTVTENGCTSIVTTNSIVVTQTPSANFNVTPTICSGLNATINYTGTGSTTAGYNWALTGAPTNPVAISGQGPHLVGWTNLTNATTTETVTLTVSENGCTSLPNSQTVQVTPVPTANFTVTSPTCAFDTALFNYIGNYAIAGANYIWNFGPSFTSQYGTGAGPMGVIWNTPGVYSVSLTVTQNGCSSTTVTNPITILTTPVVTIHIDTSVCPGQPAHLWGEGADSYVWGNGLGNAPAITVYPSITTVYSIVGTIANGCTGGDVATVSMLSIPNPDAGLDTIITLGNTANIGGIAVLGYTYTWNPILAVASIHSANTTAAPPSTTPYVLQATDINGCVGFDTVLVVVTNCTNIFIPTAFSPNGDRHNDYFFIANANQLTTLTKFEVFNRWGQKVFSTDNKASLGWDGKYNGVEQEIGSYTFFIDAQCESGEVIRKEGSVTLLR